MAQIFFIDAYMELCSLLSSNVQLLVEYMKTQKFPDSEEFPRGQLQIPKLRQVSSCYNSCYYTMLLVLHKRWPLIINTVPDAPVENKMAPISSEEISRVVSVQLFLGGLAWLAMDLDIKSMFLGGKGQENLIHV